MRSWIVLLALVLLIPTSASLLARADPKPATYEVDADASRIYVKVGTASRLGHPHGVQGNLKSGKLTLGGAGELVFDMASFTADTDEARKRAGLEKKKVSKNEARKVTDAMRGPDVLDVAKYPAASYRVSSSAPLDKQSPGEPGAYSLEGTFTLHGKEQKLRLRAEAKRGDKPGTLLLSGTFTIKQTDYGITPTSAVGGLAKVADELEITGEIVLRPKSAK